MPDYIRHGFESASSINDVDEGEVFEIFQQAQKDLFPHHGGNLRAPDDELAIHYAKEFYGRRQESDRLWIVPRAKMWEISDLTQQHPSFHALIGGDATPEGTNQSFAVFGQMQAGKPLTWLQDLEDMSLSAAAETATRIAQNSEGSYLRLWLSPRNSILELTNPDLLQPPLDRSYRRLDGYNIREKLRAARQRVQAQGEKYHE